MAEGRPVQRKLAAILAADIAGYSRLMGADEEGTLASLKALRAELIDPAIATHNGRIVKTTGDGLLVEFASVVDAMRCAIGWQSAMAKRGDSGIAWRIGVNLGDVIIDGDDIFGDGVNIAARLEGMAEPGGICISRTVLTHTLGKLDFPVKDLGEQTLKNIAQPIHVFRVLAERKPVPEASLPLPDKPSIAVLPFQNMSGDPEQEYFADGMVEEIITALSRIRWLFVIARNSSFTYKGQAVDVKRVGRELGVRYVLEGSVRKGGGRVRITAQLIEAESGTHLWADRFDGSLEDVFDLQDQVATSVAGIIEPALQTAEIRRAVERPTKDLTAYDLYLRALPSMYSFSKEGIVTALSLLEAAIARDPNFASALGAAANCRVHVDLQGWREDADENRRAGIDYGRRALAAAGENPDALANGAAALAYFGEDIGAMIAVLDRALALNPGYARGWYISGVLRVWADDVDGGIERVERSLQLSPRARVGNQLTILGSAYLRKRQFDKAATTLLMAVQEAPGQPTAYRFLAACYAHMGRIGEARDMAGRLRALSSVVMPPALAFRNPEFREFVISGLRLAMGAEEAGELA